MSYLIAYHWGWVVAALLIGLAMGWIARAQRERPGGRPLVAIAAIVIVVAIVLSLARLVPGRTGYGLDLAVIMVVAYLVGCIAGTRLRALIAPVRARADAA